MAFLIPLTMACVLTASQVQEVHPLAIVTILKVEGGKVGSVSRNKDGSVDIGPMQINSKAWLPQIANMHFGGNQAAAFYALRDNGCYNVHIGSWILRQSINECGGDVFEGIGCYHSHTPKHKEKYKAKFKQTFHSLFYNYTGVTSFNENQVAQALKK
jgi:hypothetical protein